MDKENCRGQCKHKFCRTDAEIPFGAFASLNYLYLNQFVFISASFFFDASTPLHPWFRHLIVIFVVCTKTSLSCNLIQGFRYQNGCEMAKKIQATCTQIVSFRSSMKQRKSADYISKLQPPQRGATRRNGCIRRLNKLRAQGDHRYFQNHYITHAGVI